MSRFRPILLAALLLADGEFAEAARAGEAVAPFHLNRWTSEHGLPQNTILKLLQSRDGYLWVGTRGGLARFDGVRFRIFTDELRIETNRARNAWPPEFSCVDLMEDAGAGVWVRIPDGLVHLYEGRSDKYSLRSGPLMEQVQTSIADRDGGLWIGTVTHGLRRFQNGHYTQQYTTLQGLPTDRIGLLRQDSQGGIWIGCVRGDSRLHSWQRLNPGTHQIQDLADVVGRAVPNLRELQPDQNGRLWLGTHDELLLWENGKLTAFDHRSMWDGGHGPGEMTPADHDVLWFAPPFARRLVRFARGRFDSFGTEDGLADTDFRALLWDREGNLWIGMGSGGLQQLRPRGLTSLLTKNQNDERQQIDSVFSGPSGSVWMGSSRGLLCRKDDEIRTFTNVAAGNMPFPKDVRSVLEDHSGQVWFGSQKRGLFTLEKEQIVRVDAADGQRTDWTVQALHEDRMGRLWIGSDEGLLEKRGGQFLRYTTADGLADNSIWGLASGPDGSLWFGGPKGLQRFRDGRLAETKTTRDGLLSDEVSPLLVEEDGTVWAGTPSGLNRIRGREVRGLTPREGLPGHDLLCLVDDGAGYFWASSVRGFIRMRKADLHAVADGRQSRLTYVSYGEADGAASAEGVTGCQPNATRGPDGKLWFCTTRGVAVLDPLALSARAVLPPVVIEEIVADDEIVFCDGAPNRIGRGFCKSKSELRFPAGRAQVLEIHFTANCFIAPDKVRFRYKLDGADSHWRDAGGRRVAFYTNLRPALYRFNVEASNQEGDWSRQPATASFSIAPRFSQTVWFPLSCGGGLLAVSGVIAAWRLRWQRRLLKSEQRRAIADERARIARDLHDDLGTALTGLALELDVMGRDSSRQARKISERLRQTARRTRDLAERMREVVWAVNPRCDTLLSVAAFLEQQTAPFLQAEGIRGKWEFPEELPPLAVDTEARHQLVLGVREALTNVLRHSGATEVTASLDIEHRTLVVRVHDNGRGFDPRVQLVVGHGLSNLRERFGRVGGILEIRSAPGEGATLVFKVPVRVAPTVAGKGRA